MTDQKTEPSHRADRLKAFGTWGVVVGTAIIAATFFGFLAISAMIPGAIPDSWLLDIVRQHPSGTIGVATSAMTAFSLVVVLDVFARDPIEIRFWQFEIRGAGGPVILWVVCFLSLVLGIELLWSDSQSLLSG